MNRPIASMTAAGMLLLIGLALPPPGTADDQTPPDQSPDVTERGVGDVLRPPPKPDLIVQPGGPNSCVGLFRVAVIRVWNRGTVPTGAFNTSVISDHMESIVRTDTLPPGGTVAYWMQVGCPPEGSCVLRSRVDVDGEVTESNETNNLFMFPFFCP